MLKRHGTELFELSPDERSGLMEEISAVAKALADVFKPVKMNYELLGNQLPHIHWHLIPRITGDPALKELIWTVPHQPQRLTNDALHDRIDRISAAVVTKGAALFSRHLTRLTLVD